MWTCTDDELPGASGGRGLPLRAVPAAAGAPRRRRQDGAPTRRGRDRMCSARSHPAHGRGDLARAYRAADRSAATTTESGEAGRAHLERVRERGDRLGLQAAATAFEQVGLLTRKQAFAWRFNKLKDQAWDSWRPRQEFVGRGEPRIIPGPPERAAGFQLLAAAIYEDGVVLALQRDPSTATSTPEPLQLGQF